MLRNPCNCRTQRGSILFMILLAVVLFAALSYAVTSSIRGGGNDASSESAELAAAKIFNFENLLRSTVTRMTFQNGVAVNSLKFNNDIYTSINGATKTMGAIGTPSDPSLYIFHPQGGNIVPATFEDAAIVCSACNGTAVKPGHLTVNWLNIPHIGTSSSDIAVYISSLSSGACQALNTKLGIEGIPLLTVQTTGFSGQSVAPTLAETTGSTAEDLEKVKGKTAFCYKEPTGKLRYIYYIILTSY